MRASWNVRKLMMQGRRRQAILLHHAQESGWMAGYCMDCYLQDRQGMKTVNVTLVKRAVKEMKKFERVSRLMYRAGYLSLEGLRQVISTNEQNMKELRANVNMEVVDMLTDEHHDLTSTTD